MYDINLEQHKKMTKIEELKPLELWKNFKEITKIPRGSGNEEGIRNFIINICKNNNLWFRVDSAGNLLVKKSASKGKEKVEPLLLQSHLDMVNEKNSNVNHDFLKDEIKTLITEDGEWVKAQGTTIGADNGIGVATMIAIMESKNLNHGPLELLFTVDEESGLTGATNLDVSNIESKRMINLDSEEEGSAFIACAGGARIKIIIKEEKVKTKEEKVLEIKISGLRGGHSGCDINLGRTNAIKTVFKTLEGLENYGLRITEVFGGNKDNAIPREARIKIVVEEEKYEEVKRMIEKVINAELEMARKVDEGIKIEVKESVHDGHSFSPELTKKIILLINNMPNGVLSMNKEIEGLVQTSINLGVIKSEEELIEILLMPRSSKEEELDETIIKVKDLSKSFDIEHSSRYPGWQASKESEIVKHVNEKHNRLFGKEIKIKGIHAGLECGIISSQIPDLEAVSIGPEIRNPHSPDEKVNIKSVKNFYELLIKIIEEIN